LDGDLFKVAPSKGESVKWPLPSGHASVPTKYLVGAFKERLIALEERVSDIEGKSQT
jgi:hypothetical protein